MKIAELSQRSGIPLPTLKFYIREGLLPAGNSTAKNQADYTDEHLARLALIVALRDDAGLGVAAIGSALRAADSVKHNFITAAVDAIARPAGPDIDPASPAFRRARRDVVALATDAGWRVSTDARSIDDAARALVVVRRALPLDDAAPLRPYLDAALLIARHEIPDDWRPDVARDAALHYALLGTVLFEPFILALRRLAHMARSYEIEAAALPSTSPSPASASEGRKRKSARRPAAAAAARK